jgi:anti-anti-sigma regulatory factor
MTPLERKVVIEQVPEICSGSVGRKFAHRLEARIAELVRPAVVLDCSRVRQIDKPMVHLLFCCLEEAMKRNGDVRLAGIRPEAWPALQAAGVGRLFRTFSSNVEAASSFHKPAAYRNATVPDGANQIAA